MDALDCSTEADCMQLLEALNLAEVEPSPELLFSVGRHVQALLAVGALVAVDISDGIGTRSERLGAVLSGAVVSHRTEAHAEYTFSIGLLMYLFKGESLPRQAVFAAEISPSMKFKLFFKCLQYLYLIPAAIPRAAALWRLLGRPRYDCALLPRPLFDSLAEKNTYWWWPCIADPRTHGADAADLDFIMMAVGTSSISRAELVAKLCSKRRIPVLRRNDPAFVYEYAPGFFCCGNVLALSFLHLHMSVSFLKPHVALFTYEQQRHVSHAVISTVLEIPLYATPDALASAMVADRSTPTGVVGCKLLGTPPGDAFYAFVELLTPQRRTILKHMLLNFREGFSGVDPQETLSRALLDDMISLIAVASPDSLRMVFIQWALKEGIKNRQAKAMAAQAEKRKRACD